jgi:hypothetical protein
MALNFAGLQADLEAFFRERPLGEPATRARWALIVHDYTAAMLPPSGFAPTTGTWPTLRAQARDTMDAAMVGLSGPYGGCDARVLEPELRYRDNATTLLVPGVPTPTACRSTRIGDGLAAFASTVSVGVVGWGVEPQIVTCVPPRDRFKCPVLRTADIPRAAEVWAIDIDRWFRTGSFTTRVGTTTSLPLPWS